MPVTTPKGTLRAAATSCPITGPTTILSAGYGAGGVFKDVTEIIRKLYATGKHEFWRTMPTSATPCPGWIKMLVIVFTSSEGCNCTSYAFEDTRPDKSKPEPIDGINRMIHLACDLPGH